MKKGKLILYIILIVVLLGAFALVFCSRFFAEPREAYAASARNMPSYPGNIDTLYSVETPIAGYDYYIVFQTETNYYVYFFNTEQTDYYLDMYNGYIPTYNMYSNGGDGPTTQTINTTFGGTWNMVSYTITKEYLENSDEELTAYEKLQSLLLSNVWENWAEIGHEVTKQEYTKLGFIYTYPDATTKFLNYNPIVCGNFSIQWYYGFTTSSVSSSYRQIYYAEEMFDVFKINAAYNDGLDKGYDTGYNKGYEEGYNFGLGQNVEKLTGWEIISNAFTSMFDALNVKIFGFFSLGDVFGLVIIIGIVFFIFKLVRG